MLSAVAEMLARQRARLDRLSDLDVVLNVGSFVGALDAEPRIHATVNALQDRLEKLASEHLKAESPLIRSIERISDPLDTLGVDETAMALAALSKQPRAVVLGLEDRNLPVSTPLGLTLSAALAGLHALNEPRSPLWKNYNETNARWQELLGVIRVRSREPAVALLRLRVLAWRVSSEYPSPTPLYAARTPRDRPDSNCGIQIEIPKDLDEAITAILTAPNADALIGKFQVPRLANVVRNSAHQVLDTIEAALDTATDRIELIQRFTTRSELFDRERLTDLVESDRATGRRETVLRDEFARFLFDEGLVPLTEVRLATTRADVYARLGQHGLLVEAKQYASGSAVALQLLVQKGVVQVMDTAEQLPGEHRVAEAVLLVFRRGGRRIELPKEPVRFSEIDYYLRLVDLAPSWLTGSRAGGDVVRFNIDQLFPDSPQGLDDVRAKPTPDVGADLDVPQADPG
jgi:hypothetical protein